MTNIHEQYEAFFAEFPAWRPVVEHEPVMGSTGTMWLTSPETWTIHDGKKIGNALAIIRDSITDKIIGFGNSLELRWASESDSAGNVTKSWRATVRDWTSIRVKQSVVVAGATRDAALLAAAREVAKTQETEQ